MNRRHNKLLWARVEYDQIHKDLDTHEYPGRDYPA
jgi:hypothetical protein